ncbi:MAG: L,D-transpeptidase [Mycobacteriaceae bacterium]|nr:L,D-transpeptidase [Mycobacteriaceae bacterium]
MITRLATAVGMVAGLVLGAATTAAAAPMPRQAVGAPCGAHAKACVQLSTNQAWLLSGGVVSYGPTPIRSGMSGHETPPGNFKVSFKNRNHWSTLFNAPMPFSVFFNGGIAFHQGSLDRASHGCIRMTRAGAETFFNALRPGDPVQVVP